MKQAACYTNHQKHIMVWEHIKEKYPNETNVNYIVDKSIEEIFGIKENERRKYKHYGCQQDCSECMMIIPDDLKPIMCKNKSINMDIPNVFDRIIQIPFIDEFDKNTLIIEGEHKLYDTSIIENFSGTVFSHCYIDGACSFNNVKDQSKRRGAYSFVIEIHDAEKIINEYTIKKISVRFSKIINECNVLSNNIAELYSFIGLVEFLTQINYKGYVIIYSDSQYLVDGLNIYVKQWAKNCWHKGDGSEIKNISLWMKIYELYTKHPFLNLSLNKIKGHGDNEYHTMADKMATNILK